MLVKKFTAQTLEDAIKLVKKEFGDNALILSTATQKGTLLKKGLVEVTAAQEKNTNLPQNAVNLRSETPSSLRKNTFVSTKYKPDVRATPRSVNKYFDMQEADNAPIIKRVDKREGSLKYEEGFKRVGMSQESARELAHKMVMDYPSTDLKHPVSLERIKTKLVANQVKTLSSEQWFGYKNFIALGPPGSGKTSLLVKMSVYLREKGIKTALASRERRKVVGPGEMAQYAKILKIPFVHDLRAEKGAFTCTLVDFSAMGGRVHSTQSDLEQVLSSVENPAPVIVFDATQRFEDLMRQYEWFLPYDPKAVVFTKVDLAVNLGSVFEFLRKTKLPLLSLSVSDSFKQGLKIFAPLDLASLILNGGFRTVLQEGN